MVQSINLKALTTLTSVIRRPYLASPHVHVKTISELNYTSLKEDCGIKAVVFDKDNTLTAPYDLTIHANAATGLQSALETFGTSNVAILSNSAGTGDDPDYEDARQIEESLGIAVVRHKEKKPGGLDELMSHFGDTVKEPSEICMVGDRLLTDIVFGNLYGMLTVHCLPLCQGEENSRDNKIASILRTAENKFMFTDWTVSRMVRDRTMPHAFWKGEQICPLIIQQSENLSEDAANTTATNAQTAEKSS